MTETIKLFLPSAAMIKGFAIPFAIVLGLMMATLIAYEIWLAVSDRLRERSERRKERREKERERELLSNARVICATSLDELRRSVNIYDSAYFAAYLRAIDFFERIALPDATRAKWIRSLCKRIGETVDGRVYYESGVMYIADRTSLVRIELDWRDDQWFFRFIGADQNV